MWEVGMFQLTSKSRQRKCTILKMSGKVLQSEGPAQRGCATRHRRSSMWPYHSGVEATPLASSASMSRLQVGPHGPQGAPRYNCSVSRRWLSACLSPRPSPATVSRHRHVLCSTDQHTVRRPELCSCWTATLEQFTGRDPPARQWHGGISSAAKGVFIQVTLRRIVTFCFCVPFKYSNSLTHSQQNMCPIVFQSELVLPLSYLFCSYSEWLLS